LTDYGYINKLKYKLGFRVTFLNPLCISLLYTAESRIDLERNAPD